MSLFAELKRRRVFRVAVVYAATAFAVLQAAEIMLPRLGVPDWTVTLVVAMTVLGFPIALVLGWALELTPHGIRRTESAAAIQGDVATAPSLLGKRTVLAATALVLLGIGLGAGWILKPSEQGPVLETEPAVIAAVAGNEPPSAPAAVQRSIAVLPFVNMSADPEQEYFADGLSEELLNVLAQVPDFRVVGRTSSFAFKGQSIDLREIGERLGVEHLLEGSVRRSGERVRVTAQLIRAGDGSHLWSESYDRAFADVFAIQDDIAVSVLRALQVVLDEREQQRMRNAGVRDVEAFIAYQKGRELFELAHGTLPLLPTLERANEQFDLAIARVPDFAVAYLLKADHDSHVLFSLEVNEAERAAALQTLRTTLNAAFDAARQPAQRAAIDVSRVLFSDDWSTLADRIERVIAEPGCPQTLWMDVGVVLGYARELAGLRERQSICDPLSAQHHTGRAESLIFAGEAAAALAALAEATQALGERSRFLYAAQFALLALGRHEEATALVERIPPDNNAMTARVEPLAAAGRIDEALAVMTAWIARHGEPGPSASLSMLAATGQRQRANALAARLDAAPAGPMLLLAATNLCGCGLPFDMSATPNLARRIAETGRPWPPPAVVRYPAKDW